MHYIIMDAATDDVLCGGFKTKEAVLSIARLIVGGQYDTGWDVADSLLIFKIFKNGLAQFVGDVDSDGEFIPCQNEDHFHPSR